jgi:hypothetical protein
VSPLQYLSLILFLTAVAATSQAILVHFRRQRLRRLARAWQMQFVSCDQLRLANRIAEKLPIPGVSNVCVYDLLFDTDGVRHRYLFTVEYGLGVTRGKRRRFRIAGFQEPVSRAGAPVSLDCPLTIAPEELTLANAYQYVRDALN